MGWAIDETGLPPELLRFSKRYDRPIYMLENGIADSKDDDCARQKFIVRHLRALHKGIAQGADIRGYFYWALTDNFEWAEGFGPRFGLLSVDYSNGAARKKRPAADLYARIAKDNAIPADLWQRYRR
jgi:beta-glucosidase